MPYNRYQSIQGYDPSPQEANWLGGMAYNPYSSGTDFGFALRNTLNNLLAHKQGQEEQRRAEEEQRRKAGVEEKKLGFEQRRVDLEAQRLADEEAERQRKLLEPSPYEIKVKEIWSANPTWTEGQVRNKALGIETLEEKAAKIKSTLELEHGKADIEVAHRAPREPREPSETRLRYAEIDKAVTSGWMTPREGAMEKIRAAKDNVNVTKTTTARQANSGLVAKARSDSFNAVGIDGNEKKYKEYLRKMIEDSGGQPPFSPEGYRLDMSPKYTVSTLNLEDEVADANDQDTVDLYDEMYRKFKEDLLPTYRSFANFLAAKDELAVLIKGSKLFNKNQLKRWFDLYGEE